MPGHRQVLESIIAEVQKISKLGTVVYGTGFFLIFGLQIFEDTKYKISIRGGEKLAALHCYLLLRHRGKEGDEALNAVETSSFRSANSSLAWLGSAASPFCGFYASHLQQKAPSTTVRDPTTQINSVKLLQKLRSTITYKPPIDAREYTLSVLVFADASC